MDADELLLATQSPAWPCAKNLDNVEEVRKLLGHIHTLCWPSPSAKKFCANVLLLVTHLNDHQRHDLLGWWLYVLLFKVPPFERQVFRDYVLSDWKGCGVTYEQLAMFSGSPWEGHIEFEYMGIRRVSRQLWCIVYPLVQASGAGSTPFSERLTMRICDYRHTELSVTSTEKANDC